MTAKTEVPPLAPKRYGGGSTVPSMEAVCLASLSVTRPREASTPRGAGGLGRHPGHAAALKPVAAAAQPCRVLAQMPALGRLGRTLGGPQACLGQPGLAFAMLSGTGSDQARSFAPTPQPYQFGVCASGDSSPICSVDPATVPKAMDVITPSGVSQASELNPLNGPVVIQGVTVP
jgi:hypothetical protein